MLTMTNATKAQIIIAVNAIIALLMAFGIDFTDEQQGAIVAALNAALGLWVAFTYDRSKKRAPDGP